MPAKRNQEQDGKNGWGTAFDLDAPVDLFHLDRELCEELGVDGPIGIVAEGSAMEASQSNPVTVWTMTEVDTNVFKRVFTAHDPEAARERKAFASKELRALRKKAQDDEDLTPEEMQHAIKLLLRGE